MMQTMNSEEIKNTELVQAVLEGKREHVKRLLAEGVSYTKIDQQGNTLLHYASRGGHAELVTLFVERSLPCFIKNINNQTALDIAISKSARASVLVLMQYGALIGQTITPELLTLLQKEDYTNVILIGSTHSLGGHTEAQITNTINEFAHAIRTLEECYAIKIHSAAQALSIIACIDHILKLNHQLPVPTLNELSACKSVIVNAAGKHSLCTLLQVKLQQQPAIANVLMRIGEDSDVLGEGVWQLIPIFKHHYEEHLGKLRVANGENNEKEKRDPITQMVRDEQVYLEQLALLDELRRQLDYFKKALQQQENVILNEHHACGGSCECCSRILIVIAIMICLFGILIFSTLKNAYYEATQHACSEMQFDNNNFNCICINPASATNPGKCEYTERGNEIFYIGIGMIVGSILASVFICIFSTMYDSYRRQNTRRAFLHNMTTKLQQADAHYSDYFSSLTDKIALNGDDTLEEQAKVCRSEYTKANTIHQRITNIDQHLEFFDMMKRRITTQRGERQQLHPYLSRIQFFPAAEVTEDRDLVEFHSRQVEQDIENQLGDMALVPLRSRYGTFG